MPDPKVASSLDACCSKMAGKLQIVKRRQRAFKIIGLTWIVERSFAWLGRNRRLSKDYEYSVQTSETLIEIAATRLILNRLCSIFAKESPQSMVTVSNIYRRRPGISRLPRY